MHIEGKHSDGVNSCKRYSIYDGERDGFYFCCKEKMKCAQKDAGPTTFSLPTFIEPVTFARSMLTSMY